MNMSVCRRFLAGFLFAGLLISSASRAYSAEDVSLCDESLIMCALEHPNAELRRLIDEYTKKISAENGIDEARALSPSIKFALANYNRQFGASDELTADENMAFDLFLRYTAIYEVSQARLEKMLKERMNEKETEKALYENTFERLHTLANAYGEMLHFLYVLEVKRNCFAPESDAVLSEKKREELALRCGGSLALYRSAASGMPHYQGFAVLSTAVVWEALKNNGRWKY